MIIDLTSPRTIASASEIPVFASRHRGLPVPVRLLRARAVNARYLESCGAVKLNEGWVRHRTEDFPFERLDHFLPRMARRTLTPEIVDLIPATSWFASLANLLTRTSWEVLRAPLVAHHGGCEDCGGGTSLEAHENWLYEPYDEDSGVQSLSGIVVLCKVCHETRHLGLARMRGRFGLAFSRLCAVNRISTLEAPVYLREIESRWEIRSDMEWALDLRLPAGMRLDVRPSVIHAGDGWLMGRTAKEEVAVRVVDVGVEETAGRVTLVGLTKEQLAQAHGEYDDSENDEGEPQGDDPEEGDVTPALEPLPRYSDDETDLPI